MKKFAFLALSLFVASSFMACHDEYEQSTNNNRPFFLFLILLLLNGRQCRLLFH